MPHYHIYVYMTQDACLEDNQAIEKLVDKFTDSKIGAVCGRQLPHHNANALAQHARYFNYPEKVQVTFVKDRPGHDARYAIDSAKIERELGWVPEETFETGLRKTVQWYLDNHQWWERVLSGEYKLGRLGVNG